MTAPSDARVRRALAAAAAELGPECALVMIIDPGAVGGVLYTATHGPHLTRHLLCAVLGEHAALVPAKNARR